jgi:hypothetical protein
MTRNLAVRLILLSGLLVGCAGQPRDAAGLRVVEYHPGGPIDRASAPYAANFALYADAAPDQPAGQAMLWRGLSENEPLGFARTAEGALEAVAGPDHVPLTEGRYCWHLTPETELHGAALARHDTANVMAGVARLYGGVVLAVLLFPVIVLWQIPVSPFPF